MSKARTYQRFGMAKVTGLQHETGSTWLGLGLGSGSGLGLGTGLGSELGLGLGLGLGSTVPEART